MKSSENSGRKLSGSKCNEAIVAWITAFAETGRSPDSSLWPYPSGPSALLPERRRPTSRSRTTKSILLRKPVSDLDLAATNSQGMLPAIRCADRLERRQVPDQLAPVVQRPGRSPVMLSEHFAVKLFSSASGALSAHS